MRITLALFAVAACAPHHANATWPACIRAESGDHTSGVREFRFDANGNVSTIRDRDNHGQTLEYTQIDWSANAVTERPLVPPPVFVTPPGHGTLGDHGELLDWHVGNAKFRYDVTLVWTGNFAPGLPRRAFEMPYVTAHYMGGRFIPLDTRDRTFLTRMRPFSFTGTVKETIVTAPSDDKPTTEVVEGDFRDGRLVEMRADKRRTVFTWNGVDLASFVTTMDGAEIDRVAVETRGGRIVALRETSAPKRSMELSYIGDDFTGYKEHYPERDGSPAYDASVTVERCAD